MTNYLLTVIGTFESEQDCTQIGMSLTPIVDSRNLKFQPDKRVLLFYFASEVPKEELDSKMETTEDGESKTETNEIVSVEGAFEAENAEAGEVDADRKGPTVGDDML